MNSQTGHSSWNHVWLWWKYLSVFIPLPCCMFLPTSLRHNSVSSYQCFFFFSVNSCTWKITKKKKYWRVVQLSSSLLTAHSASSHTICSFLFLGIPVFAVINTHPFRYTCNQQPGSWWFAFIKKLTTRIQNSCLCTRLSSNQQHSLP